MSAACRQVAAGPAWSCRTSFVSSVGEGHPSYLNHASIPWEGDDHHSPASAAWRA